MSGTFLAQVAAVALVLGAPNTTDDSPDGRYVEFVGHEVQRLLREQTAPLGGRKDGVQFITVTRPATRGWVSLGMWLGNRYQLVNVPAQEVEIAPTMADLEAWPLLDLLSERTGEPGYGERVDRMAAAFAEYGFDPASGLAGPLSDLS